MGGGRGIPPESTAGGGEDGGGGILFFVAETNLFDKSSPSASINEGVRVEVLWSLSDGVFNRPRSK